MAEQGCALRNSIDDHGVKCAPTRPQRCGLSRGGRRLVHQFVPLTFDFGGLQVNQGTLVIDLLSARNPGTVQQAFRGRIVVERPRANQTVHADRDQLLAAFTKRDKDHAVGMAQWRRGGLTGSCVPHAGRFVVTCCCDQETVWTKGTPPHFLLVAEWAGHGLAGADVPNACCAVRAGRHQARSVRAQRQICDEATVTSPINNFTRCGITNCRACIFADHEPVFIRRQIAVLDVEVLIQGRNRVA
jgi:hypothetical protein